MLYTLSLSEAETQLRDLVTRTQKTHSPILLTSEDTAAPLAVVMEIDAYEQTQRRKQQLYQLQLMQLMHCLDQVEEHWEDRNLRQECITSWQESMDTLWDACPECARGLCASLMLAVRQMEIDYFSLEQVSALRYAARQLRYSAPDAENVEIAYQKLIESGLYLTLAFDDAMVQSYIDEL